MGPCCVEGCDVTSEDTYYFEFPTSRPLRRKWLEVIPITGKLALGMVVCSRHFSADDYENVRGKVRLKRKVVPSLLLDQMQTSPKARPKSPTPPKDVTPKSQISKLPVSPPKSPVSPPKSPGTCDTTVSVPNSRQTMDPQKVMDHLKRTISNFNLMLHNAATRNAVRTSSPPLDHKEDIEDMITNYHIKNKVPNPALLADLEPPPSEPAPSSLAAPTEEPIEIDDVKEAEPVFIEISVDKDASTAGAGSQDCLMLLESVQVDVDPETLMLAHEDDFDHEEEKAMTKKDASISLLTSSDEDDVILQEPHIDTVEVSDETDEDDMPLVKLVKKKPDKKFLKKKSKRPRQNIEKIMWGVYDYYCIQCHYTTTNSKEYNKHIAEHSNRNVLQVCQICGYTSASNTMFTRHTRLHKVEKKFKCHLCDYRARHKMSLIFHLKNHDNNTVKSVTSKKVKCKKCDIKSSDEGTVLGRACSCVSEKKHVCQWCEYSTNKKSDLKRHITRRHQDLNVFEDDEVEFVPSQSETKDGKRLDSID